MNPIPADKIPQAVNELAEAFTYIRHRLAYLWQMIATMQAAIAVQAAGRRSRLPLSFKAQNGEDILIWSALGNKLDGFYVEAGAFDGVGISATYALEAIGWRGLLVEPNSESHKRCVTNRPNSRVVRAALSSPENAGKMATLNRIVDVYGGALSYMEGVRLYGDNNDRESAEIVKEQVEMTTLDALLEGHEGPIDAVVIDVEGHEPEVLRGFDIGRWLPTILLVEDVSVGEDKAITDYMIDKPYRQVGWNENNRVYIREDAREAMSRYPGLSIWP